MTEYRNPFMEILSAVEPDDRPGVFLTRGQLEAWAGRELTDEDVECLDEEIQHSSIPESIATMADSLNANEEFEAGRRQDSGIWEDDDAQPEGGVIVFERGALTLQDLEDHHARYNEPKEAADGE